MDSLSDLRSPISKVCLITGPLWSATSIAQAQTLWKGARVGMSVHAVQERFPKAMPPAAPTSTADGSRELLRLSDTTVQGHAFDALFFLKGELQHVHLELRETGGAVFDLQTFRGIKAAFDAKYRPPDDEQDQSFNAATGTATFRKKHFAFCRQYLVASLANQ